ncbi:hypothetical protein HDU87_007434 [Geranomyces variabilis]|uniref:Pyridoxamine 5'-phosphate oxidase Alr4036 family FMN-binding domain-containing protein n=1 Tax=Geranomyces variabilis TaxID=109894 RepID=A0AAD5TSB5_9FUNG|nr:hypothetical protein HDU87_007434 [Geranomyces variabilis]
MLGDSEPVPAWNPVIVRSFKKNYDATKEPVYCQLASVRPNGTPKIQRVVFQDFLAADPKVLMFAAPTRSAELMAVVKGSQTHELFWQMPKTGETFTITGRMYMVAAPTMSHRFGAPPRRITTGATNQDEFWELERLRQWKRLSPAYRASFTWPAPGEPQNSAASAASEGSVYSSAHAVKIGAQTDTGFKYTRLDAMEEQAPAPRPGGSSTGMFGALVGAATGGGSTADNLQDLRSVHNSALDQFALLVLKAQKVDHWTPNSLGPPTRIVYESGNDGWRAVDVNP